MSAPDEPTLAGGSSTTVTVTFQPATTAAFVAMLTITSENGGSPAIALSGAGTPGISVTPDALEFGDTSLGLVSSATVTIANHDPTPVTLTPPFAIGGANADQFAVASPSTTVVAPGGAATAAVSFQPTTVGAKSATVTVSSVSGGARTVSLTGNAVCAPLTITETLPDGEFGFAYSGLTASGGPAPLAFAVMGGALPPGLVLDVGGALSGTPTALGTSTFTVQATAANACTGTADFAITIRDTRAPSLTLPGDLTATATSPSGAAVTYTASASDLVDGARAVSCSPASGSTFPIGTTQVNCSTSDAHGNTATGLFNITVTAAAQPGRMTGDGEIEIGVATHAFAFLVQERTSGGDLGAIRYEITTRRPGRDQEDRFDAITVTGVTFFNVPGISPGPQPPSGIDTVTFTGTGRWNGRSGYTFDARATDAGEPGPGHDSFAITIRDAGGHVVASVDSVITSGNVESLGITR